MSRFTKEERLEIYKKSVEVFDKYMIRDEIVCVGFCCLLREALHILYQGELLNDIGVLDPYIKRVMRTEFPEVSALYPADYNEQRDYWFVIGKNNPRRRMLEEIIKSMEESINN